MVKNILFLIILLLSVLKNLPAQDISFDYEKTPLNSGFKMEGYWVWGGTLIKVDSVYHMFASRWPKISEFPDGYRNYSEIVHATADNALGPFQFEKVVIGERDSSFWDSNMAHNPTIYKIGDEYVLFYIGSDFTTRLPGSDAMLRRTGYASAKSIYGPWERSGSPLFENESNNPSLLIEDERVLLIYRDEKLQVYMAESDSYKGPYRAVNNNLWPHNKIEDFYLFKSGKGYHMICEDNEGGISGHVRWGVHLFSENGLNNWQKYSPLIAYNHEVAFENDSIFHCKRRERPQLFIENNKIKYLLTAVLDGKNSWCQPVKLKQQYPYFKQAGY